MTTTDYKVMDMPTHLGRSALKQDPFNPNKWVKDDDWYEMTKEINESLYNFFQDHDLINQDCKGKPIEKLILRLSDFNRRGKAFICSGAVDRWLGRFDRPRSRKSFSDVRYLENALRKIP